MFENFLLLDEQGSTDTKNTSELEQTTSRETVCHQSSAEHGKYSGIKIRDSSPRKRRQLTEDFRIHEKKRSYDLEKSVQTLALEHKGSSSETAKLLQKDSKPDTKSPKSGQKAQSNLSAEEELVQQEETDKKQATCQTKHITKIKSSSSSEISSTSKQPTSAEDKLFQSVFKWPNLFDQDVDGDT
jgi:hypothetical protein